MIEPLTPNTQAILLLTAPLIVGRSGTSRDLLTLSEYNKLARLLRDRQHQPADLLGPNAPQVLPFCIELFGGERLQTLLGRGFLLSQAVEHWNSRAIWVISRADARYPKRLKSRLKEDAPPLLYGCGDIALLDKGGLAVVGSRHVDDELISYTVNVGRISAEAHRVVVSGGAKGIDRAAMSGALLAHGVVVGVMADSLERAALSRENREPLMAGRLALVSPYDPVAGFNVGHAMQRNKVVYALADASLVVTSDFEKGGTWAGALEQLSKFRFGPLFVRNGAKMTKGNSALLQRGGQPWPEPKNGSELEQAITNAMASPPITAKQATLPFGTTEECRTDPPKPAQVQLSAAKQETVATGLPHSLHSGTRLLDVVREIVQAEMVEPRTEQEVAALLDVTRTQAKAWIKQLVEGNTLQRIGNGSPARYCVVRRQTTEHLLAGDAMLKGHHLPLEHSSALDMSDL